jgi:hypothetical protein
MGDVLVRHNTWILCWQIEPGDGTRRARCGVSTWAVQIAKSSSACIVRGKGHIILDLIDPAVDVHVLRVFVRRSDSHSGDASQFDANISRQHLPMHCVGCNTHLRISDGRRLSEEVFRFGGDTSSRLPVDSRRTAAT